MRSVDVLERETSLRALKTQLADARAGRGSLVLLGGEAGIGKTTLIRRFQDDLPNDVRVLVGGCEPMRAPRPLGPLLDIASSFGPRFLAAFAGEPRASIFDLFLLELRRAVHPTVVVFEDVHWADEATRDLLRFLGRRIGGTRSLLIATFRGDEVGPRHPLRVLVGDLVGSPAVKRLTLNRLSFAAVAHLARGFQGDVEALHRMTGGNPFFVAEVLASRSLDLPWTVRDAVLARAARLEPDARHALDVASVIGPVFDLAVLEALAIETGAVDACEQAGFIETQASSWGFRHELVRDAVYRTLSGARRRALHRLVLGALEASPSGRDALATLAHHAAAAGDATAALRYAPAAARRAAELGAHEEARAQYASTLPYLDGIVATARVSLLEAYATECTIVDRLEESASVRRDVVERWRALGQPLRVGFNLSLLAQALEGLGRRVEAQSASDEAIAVLERFPKGPELARAYWYHANLAMLDGDTDAALAYGDRAIALSQRVGDIAMLANAHMTVGTTLLRANRPGADVHLASSLVLGREHGLPNLVATVHTNRGATAGEGYRFDEAKAELELAATLTEEHGHDNIRSYALAWLALIAMYQGAWTTATDLALDVLARRQLSTSARITALVTLGRVRSRRGDPEAAAVLDEALALADRTGTFRRIGPVRAARAEAASLAHDEERVREEVGAVYDIAVAQRHPWIVGELALWRSNVDDRSPPPPTWIAEPFALQLAGRIAESSTAWLRLGCPYEAARVACEGGDAGEARRAFTILGEMGARPASQRAARVLRELGVRVVPRGPRDGTRAHPALLTPREAQVLDLLAQGLRNDEIARRHGVSPRTVGHQVSSVLDKLAVPTRTAAVAEARRRGLLNELR